MVSAVLVSPAMAHAQSAAEDETREARLQEIVVTAQRREENLQSVPVAVTAFAGDVLERQQISDIADLDGLAPGLQAQVVSGAAPIITIRGMNGGGIVLPGLDSPVATYIDGVYLGRTVGTLFDMTDVERIEVLRGPQGTLFGRNATAGAINFISKAPNGKLELQQDVSIGDRDYVRSRTRISLPEWKGFSVQMSYLHSEEDGWARNTGDRTYQLSTLTGGKVGTIRSARSVGRKNVDGVNVAVRFQPSTDLTVDYRFDYSDNYRTDPAIQLVGFSGSAQGIAAAQLYADQGAIGGDTGNLSRERLDRVNNSLTSVQHLVVSGHSLTVSAKLSDALTLKSITAFRRSRIDPYGTDNRGSGGVIYPYAGASYGKDYVFGGTVITTKSRQFSQELQLLYHSDLLDVTAGGFYFDEHAPYYAVSFGPQVLPQAPAEVTSALGGISNYITDNSSLAGYVQATLHPIERLSLTGGVRYTEDKRETDLVSAFIGVGALPSGLYKQKFSHTDFTAIASYEVADDAMAYAKVATAYTSGGVLSGLAFKPQSLIAYEAGIKSELFDRKLRLNVAGYYQKVKNLQVPLFTRGFLEMTNAGKAEGYGLEIELQAAPVRNVMISAGVSLQKYKYLEYFQNGVNLGTTGLNTFKPNMVSPRSASVSAKWDFLEFDGGGQAYVSFDGNYRSRQRTMNAKTGNADLDAFALYAGQQMLVNGRIGLTDLPLGPVAADLALWVRNIFDQDKLESAANTGRVVTGYFVEPRRFGVDMSVKF